MTILEIIRLLVRNFYYIAATALLLAFLAYNGTKDAKKEYSTHTLLNTGLISGYSIESSGGGRIDYAKTNNDLENLITLATSYETNKLLSANLLAEFLFEHNKGTLSILQENYPDFLESIKDLPIEIDENDSKDRILGKIIAIRDADKSNKLYAITNSDNIFFGVTQMGKITVSRKGNSDMIRMEYTSIDPHAAQRTLEVLTDIFITAHKANKEGQTESVVGFFADAVNNSTKRLKDAEADLLDFRVSNRIINYYEQTRYISGHKEELEKMYQEELKIAAGSGSALARIEEEMADKSMLPSIQAKIAENRSLISKNIAELTELELVMDSIPNESRTIQKSNLSGEIDLLKAEMNNMADQIVLVNQTSEGVETKDLLTQWLNQTIAKEESEAKLAVMEKRKKEFREIYDEFAPLGSTLKKIEREIDVAEREYLENLHSYNQARLHKYSSMMSSNLEVIDAPYYPINPSASKAMMMVILAFMVGMILPTSLLVAMEFLDSSLKKPEQASEQTKLKVGGILPKQPRNLKRAKVDFEAVNKQALNIFIQQIRAETKGLDTPKRVNIISTQRGEGKEYLISQLKNYFTKYLSIDEDSPNKEFEFHKVASILHEPYSEAVVKQADVHILVARANRNWTPADEHAVKVYAKLAGKKPLLFLNGVSTDVLEQVIGEVPKRRGFLRAIAFKLVTQGLKSSKV